MHEPLKSQVENLLRGTVSPEIRSQAEAHLNGCVDCRLALEEMRLHSGLLRALRAPQMEPPPGFYARVMQRVETQGLPSFWSLLLDPIFGRRLAYAAASLALLMAALMLATAPESDVLAQTPVEVIAAPSQNTVPLTAAYGDDVHQDRETFLVTLASTSAE